MTIRTIHHPNVHWYTTPPQKNTIKSNSVKLASSNLDPSLRISSHLFQRNIAHRSNNLCGSKTLHPINHKRHFFTANIFDSLPTLEKILPWSGVVLLFFTTSLVFQFARRLEAKLQEDEKNDKQKKAPKFFNEIQEFNKGKNKEIILNQIKELSHIVDSNERIHGLLEFLDCEDPNIRILCYDTLAEILELHDSISIKELINIEEKLYKITKISCPAHEFFKLTQVYSAVIENLFTQSRTCSFLRKYIILTHTTDLLKNISSDFPFLEANALKAHLNARFLPSRDFSLFYSLFIARICLLLPHMTILLSKAASEHFKKMIPYFREGKGEDAGQHVLKKMSQDDFQFLSILESIGDEKKIKSMGDLTRLTVNLISMFYTSLNLRRDPYGYKSLINLKKHHDTEAAIDQLSLLFEGFKKRTFFCSKETKEWSKWLFIYETLEILQDVIKNSNVAELNRQKAGMLALNIADKLVDVYMFSVSWKVCFKIQKLLSVLDKTKLCEEKQLEKLKKKFHNNSRKAKWKHVLFGPLPIKPLLNPDDSAKLYEAHRTYKAIQIRFLSKEEVEEFH